MSVQISPAEIQHYIYFGDKYTDDRWQRKDVTAVRYNGKCVRGKNGSMLVQIADGMRAVIIGRRLRKVKA